ncbi:putative microtubule-associated protein [Fasciolopsis buskii]|uniref:Putative microtubule-associated protein n=1 Tax=Fasciolopsis buskii TaxID=27845 RepID=A0A8E0VR05_9TREM|nr:putative microtubule-associated protein [Fasciolopsis buski]
MMTDNIETAHQNPVWTIAARCNYMALTETGSDTVIFSSANENIAANVVCRPKVSSLSTALNNLIAPPASADVPIFAAVVYAGLIAKGSGRLVRPSYVFTPKALSDQIEALATALPKPTDSENQPAYKAIHLHLAFSAVTSGGQAVIFAIPGYNLLVNAGCAHHPSFWLVANNLDWLDAVLLTHWGVDNLLGSSSVLPVAFARPIDAVSDSTSCLPTPPPNPNGLYKLPDPNPNRSLLAMSIPREIAKLMGELKWQGTNVFTQTLTRGKKMASAAQPVRLFQKVGQGCLELSSLAPTDDDSAELRKVTDDWAKASPALLGASLPLGRSPPANKFTVPLLSHTSASTLVVWKPSRDTGAILRILFVSPNAHQARVLVSLEAIAVSNIYLRHARAVPSDYERKRSTATALGRTRRSVLPGLSVTSSKPTSLIGEGSAPTKSTAGRLSTLSEKKLVPGRTGVP